MVRLILGIIAAPVLWGVISVPINLGLASLYGDTAAAPPFPTSYLVIALVLSVGYGLFAGYGAAWIAGTNERKLSLGAGIALLIFGLGVQIGNWDAIPIWWHIIFLAMLVPVCMYGASLRKT
ncbi:MAG: hypothetical protein EP301_10735 [Gammaproteobacteria bacterium]|jgi:hypothetical protein|nr:MAG: hypothetical protein EP301_10735 [Gammaproteobacteria bacterium]